MAMHVFQWRSRCQTAHGTVQVDISGPGYFSGCIETAYNSDQSSLTTAVTMMTDVGEQLTNNKLWKL